MQGHDVPQEAREAFADAVLDIDARTIGYGRARIQRQVQRAVIDFAPYEACRAGAVH
jgi:hypothetical protein